ncbi:hypothetical protein PR002_g13634 [Phytophthora rubi]|uniref:Uncharacterized protein n=1 Tax=Phytophthora rubi TaxID=129364 RepID=A0A6A3LAS6_9STRA|nr:hypothetical protein PR002_g13634 [Phytophthora rubi]
MSAEVWGDWISGICDDAQCFDPLMRYQYFLAGLRNSEWKTVLSTTMVSSVQQAVTVLLYMNMHLPVEDDSDFADEIASETPTKDMITLPMMQTLQQNQNMMLQQHELTRGLHSLEGTAFASAAYERDAPPGMPNALMSTPASVSRTDYYDAQCSAVPACQEMMAQSAQANMRTEGQLLAQQ